MSHIHNEMASRKARPMLRGERMVRLRRNLDDGWVDEHVGRCLLLDLRHFKLQFAIVVWRASIHRLHIPIDVEVGWVGAVGPVAARRPSDSGCSLRPRPRWVGTAIFAMGDSEVCILGLVLYPVNGLDGIRDVCEVDEGAVPNMI